MSPSPNVSVRINLPRIRQNVLDITRRTGVPVIAVVKADAYGLRAQRIAIAIGDLVAGFYVLSITEAIAAKLHEITGKRTIALMGESNDPDDYIRQGVHPVVWTTDRASALKRAKPILSVDTGQGRFACRRSDVADVVRAGDIHEAMTHASTLDQVQNFQSILNEQPGGAERFFKHAAGSSLLNEPAAWLQAARPGLALYNDTVRVSTTLLEVKESTGPAGYTGFRVPRFGLILAGYSNGLSAGPCLINGKIQRILEVGMQSAFVEVDPHDQSGDEVVLLGDQLNVQTIAKEWIKTPQEVLLRLSSCGCITNDQ